MTKNEIRDKYRNIRKKLSQDQVEELSMKIANRSLKLPVWDHKFYHIFLSIAEQKEVDTEFLLHILQGKDKEVVVPRTNPETRDLTNYLLTDNTVIRKSKWNIPEPQEGIEIKTSKIDVVFIPLLAFDIQGHRVGYGKGFYDRFLAKCRPDVVKIGLSFFEPEEAIQGIINGDVPLDYCITPEQVYDFSH